MVQLSQYKNRLAEAMREVKKNDSRISEDPRIEFLNELAIYGFTPPKVLKNGVIDRIDAPADKRGQNSGWYIFNQYEDIAVGTFGAWKGEPEKVTWTSKNTHNLTYKERLAFNQAVEEAEKKRKQEEKIRHGEVASKAFAQWSESEDATPDNPYIKRKQVKVYDGIKRFNETLIVPVTLDEQLTSLQYILPDGTKKFMSGGRTQGCYYKLKGNDNVIYIAEGYATAASVREATGNSVYIAFSAHNLYEVASKVKAEYKESEIILLGENNETFLTKAKQIYDSLRIEAIYPPETEDDFNDVHVNMGIDAVKAFFINPQSESVIRKTISNSNTTSDYSFDFGGVLQEIVNYYNATSGNKQPLFAIQSAIATLSTILSRNFETNMSNRASLFLLNIAKSGTGKEHAKKVAETILEATDNGHLIAGDGYTSGAAVISALQERPRHLTVIDEFSKYLQAAQNKYGSSHLMEANAMMMQVISRLDGTVRARSYATIGLTKDKKRELANQYVINPAITLMAMSTPDDLFKTIDISSIKDGFLNRFVICISDAERAIREHKEKIDVPQSIIEWDLEIKNRVGDNFENPMEEPKPITLNFTMDAMNAQVKFQQYCIDMSNSLENFGMEDMPNRSNEMAMRLSLIVALSRDPNAKVITLSDMQTAINYVQFNLDRLVKKLKMSVSQSEYEGAKKEVLQALRNLGDSGITWADMQKKAPFSKYKARELKEILEALYEGNFVSRESFQNGGKGRPTTLYKVI